MEFLAELHPLIVHFPIAILILYSIIEISGISIKNDFLLRMAHLLLAIGVLTAIAAVLTGNQAAAVAEQLSGNKVFFPKEIVEEHETYATFALWFFAGLLVLRTYLVLKKKFIGILRYIFIPLAIIGIFLIYKTGNYGGELVYDHGVGTKFINFDSTKIDKNVDEIE